MEIVALQLIHGGFVVGGLVETTEEGVILNKPIIFQEAMGEGGRPQTIPFPYGFPFIVQDIKEDRQVEFKNIHIIVDPAPVFSSVKKAYLEAISLIQTKTDGIVLAG